MWLGLSTGIGVDFGLGFGDSVCCGEAVAVGTDGGGLVVEAHAAHASPRKTAASAEVLIVLTRMKTSYLRVERAKEVTA